MECYQWNDCHQTNDLQIEYWTHGNVVNWVRFHVGHMYINFYLFYCRKKIWHSPNESTIIWWKWMSANTLCGCWRVVKSKLQEMICKSICCLNIVRTIWKKSFKNQTFHSNLKKLKHFFDKFLSALTTCTKNWFVFEFHFNAFCDVFKFVPIHLVVFFLCIHFV